MKAVALIASGIEQGRLLESSRTGIDSVELKSRFWRMFHAGGSPEVALAYIAIGSSFVVGLSIKPSRQEGAGSERIARPSFWGWTTDDKTRLRECILRLLFFPSPFTSDGEIQPSWIDQIIEETVVDQGEVQDRVSCVLDIVSRFGKDLAEFVEVKPINVGLGSGLPGRNGLSTSFVAVDGPNLRDLLRIALNESDTWIADEEALIGGFGNYRTGGLTTYKVDRYPPEKTFKKSKTMATDGGTHNPRAWSALKWWK